MGEVRAAPSPLPPSLLSGGGAGLGLHFDFLYEGGYRYPLSKFPKYEYVYYKSTRLARSAPRFHFKAAIFFAGASAEGLERELWVPCTEQRWATTVRPFAAGITPRHPAPSLGRRLPSSRLIFSWAATLLLRSRYPNRFQR